MSNAPLAIDTPSPRHPQLLIDREDSVHLAWLSRREGIQELYHQVIKHETFAPDRVRYAYQRIEELGAKRK